MSYSDNEYETGGQASAPGDSQPRYDSIRQPDVHFNVEIDIDNEHRAHGQQGGGGGGGGGSRVRPETVEKRTHELTSPPRETYPVQVHQLYKTTAMPPQPAQFHMQDAVMRLEYTDGRTKDALWLEGGSLRTLEDEHVICRYAGVVSDVLQIYHFRDFVMMTDRRILIKTMASLFGINVQTVEESFLYSNLQHVAVKRVTNFRYLSGGILACLMSITFFGLAAVAWSYALFGLVLFFLGLMLIYWFCIFYNTNSLVIDFSNSKAVGSWWSGKGKGSYIVKSIYMKIDVCFDIMYLLYNHSKTKFVLEAT